MAHQPSPPLHLLLLLLLLQICQAMQRLCPAASQLTSPVC
jgi:hypothetical protein